MKIYVNGKLVLKVENYENNHRNSNGNIILLNGFGFAANDYIYPFKGKITDVNVWNMTLAEKDVLSFSLCDLKSENPTIKWKEAQFEYSDSITLEDIEFEEVCYKGNNFMAFYNDLDFSKTIKFCEKLGGNIAVADDQTKLIQMKEAYQKIDFCPEEFYTGHWNKGGQWKSFVDHKPLTWAQWIGKSVFNDCSRFNIADM